MHNEYHLDQDHNKYHLDQGHNEYHLDQCHNEKYKITKINIINLYIINITNIIFMIKLKNTIILLISV